MKLTTTITAVLVIWLGVRLLVEQPSDLLQLVFCDVGQGDATLILYNYTQVLVDGGRDSMALECLSNHLPFWDRTIELLVATHPDADHIAGLPSILGNYRVKQAITNGEDKKTDDFEALEKALQREKGTGAEVLIAHGGQQIVINDHLVLTVLSPLESSLDATLSEAPKTEQLLSDVGQPKSSGEINHNDGSIVLLLTFGQVDVLLMGDLESGGEQALIKNGLIKDVDILKVGHHGSKTSSTNSFLAVARPEISIISAGKNNKYGHPAPQVLRNLEEIHSKVIRTDIVGAVVVSTDGESIWLEGERGKIH